MNDLCSARSKLATDLSSALEAARVAPADKKPVILCYGPGGLGKSHTTAHLLRHQRVTWMAPKNSAQAEVETFLEANRGKDPWTLMQTDLGRRLNVLLPK